MPSSSTWYYAGQPTHVMKISNDAQFSPSHLGAAEIVITPDGVSRARLGLSVRDGDETVRARVERAERPAALGLLARVAVAERGLSVKDGDEAVRAANGVAEQIAALGLLARVAVAERGLSVRDGDEAVRAANGVAEQGSVVVAVVVVVLVGVVVLVVVVVLLVAHCMGVD